ncbi:MAG TPA: hypothetical protein VMM78_06475 [Thermomicrobiales bacterium]|nr:hypothetical protein [Thermomicrobiales bacterium]
MTTAGTRVAAGRLRRSPALRVLLWGMLLLSLTAMGGIPGLLAPWVFLGDWPGHEFPEIHRWHDAQWGALFGLLIGGSLAFLARRPDDRPLLVQFLLAATGGLVLLNAPFDPLILLGLLFGVFGPIAAIALLLPRRIALTSLRPDSLRAVNWPLVAISLLSGALMARPAWRWYDLQLMRFPDEHSQFQHWTISAVLAVVLVSGGLLAATGRPGSRWLGILCGVTFIYLGLAALRVPDHPGSWGTEGGLLAMAAGVAFIAATLIYRSGRSRGLLTAQRSTRAW